MQRGSSDEVQHVITDTMRMGPLHQSLWDEGEASDEDQSVTMSGAQRGGHWGGATSSAQAGGHWSAPAGAQGLTPPAGEWPQDSHSQRSWLTARARSSRQLASRNGAGGHLRPSSHAAALLPQDVSVDRPTPKHVAQFEVVMQSMKKTVEDLMHVVAVELSQHAGGWSFIVRPHADSDLPTDRFLTIAKEALLEAATQAQCMFILGYCSAKPFAMRPQGFEATLGLMENKSVACWHLFKKGFCRHGESCNKQHPALQMPVRILIASMQLNALASDVDAFQQEIAAVAKGVTTILQNSACVERVEALMDTGDSSGHTFPGWTIQVMVADDTSPHAQDLLTLAQNALFGATACSKNVYIMGYAATPFMPRPNGFVAMLGDMQNEAGACWDLYSLGVCRKDWECRWQHPGCLVPLNVILVLSL